MAHKFLKWPTAYSTCYIGKTCEARSSDDEAVCQNFSTTMIRQLLHMEVGNNLKRNCLNLTEFMVK